MPLSDFEIRKLTELVAGQVGARLDAKTLRQVVDSVMDNLKQNQGNPEIKGVTCDVSRPQPTAPRSTAGTVNPLPPEEAMLTNRGGLYEQIENTKATRVIIAAFGKNRPGVVAAITKELAELNCSIEDISQTIMQEFFSMIMIVDIAACSLEFSGLRDRIKATETKLGMQVFVMHEDIFRYMHRI